MRKVMMFEDLAEPLETKARCNVLDREGKDLPEKDHCILLCKKLGPNVFFIKSGLAFIGEGENEEGTLSLSAKCATKIFFIPEESLV